MSQKKYRKSHSEKAKQSAAPKASVVVVSGIRGEMKLMMRNTSRLKGARSHKSFDEFINLRGGNARVVSAEEETHFIFYAF